VTWVCSYDEVLFDLAVWDRKVRGSVCKRILLSRNVCVLTKIIRGKFRSCGFGSNFCPVEVAQWPKASVHEHSGRKPLYTSHYLVLYPRTLIRASAGALAPPSAIFRLLESTRIHRTGCTAKSCTLLVPKSIFALRVLGTIRIVQY